VCVCNLLGPLGCGVAQSRVQRRSVRVRRSSVRVRRYRSVRVRRSPVVSAPGYVRPGSNPGPASHGELSKLSSSDEEIYGVHLQGQGGANDCVNVWKKNEYKK
jgi:hypothetical protein